MRNLDPHEGDSMKICEEISQDQLYRDYDETPIVNKDDPKVIKGCPQAIQDDQQVIQDEPKDLQEDTESDVDSEEEFNLDEAYIENYLKNP